MATLKCNSCGGEITSNARRVQCPHCAALFPFACAECGRNLRPPFSEYADERYLTLDESPRPLCEEHYLRRCPDCDAWFGAHKNPGYFRCPDCAQIHEHQLAQAPAEPPPLEAEAMPSAPLESSVATKARAPGGAKVAAGGPNALVLAFAACALLALLGWMLLGH